jgi:hypothetical protein
VELDLDVDDAAGSFECANCGVVTDTLTAGWRGVTSADTERPDAPALALFCPDCAALELADEA